MNGTSVLRDSAELKISIELVQPIAERAHVYRRSIVRWRTLLDKKVEDDFKNLNRSSHQHPVSSPNSKHATQKHRQRVSLPVNVPKQLPMAKLVISVHRTGFLH